MLLVHCLWIPWLGVLLIRRQCKEAETQSKVENSEAEYCTFFFSPLSSSIKISAASLAGWSQLHSEMVHILLHSRILLKNERKLLQQSCQT